MSSSLHPDVHRSQPAGVGATSPRAYYSGIVLLVLVLALVGGQSQLPAASVARGTDECLRVRSLLIVDETGRVCGTFRGEAGGICHLTLGSDGEDAAVELSSNRSGRPRFVLRNADGTPALGATITEDGGAELILADTSGRRRFEVSTARGRQNISLFDDSGQRSIHLQVIDPGQNEFPPKSNYPGFEVYCSKIGSRLHLSAEDRDRRVSMGLSKSRQPELMLLAPEIDKGYILSSTLGVIELKPSEKGAGEGT